MVDVSQLTSRNLFPEQVEKLERILQQHLPDAPNHDQIVDFVLTFDPNDFSRNYKTRTVGILRASILKKRAEDNRNLKLAITAAKKLANSLDNFDHFLLDDFKNNGIDSRRLQDEARKFANTAHTALKEMKGKQGKKPKWGTLKILRLAKLIYRQDQRKNRMEVARLIQELLSVREIYKRDIAINQTLRDREV